jgi:hypothetical protein
MKNMYKITYFSNGKKISDVFSTLSIIIVLLLARISNKIEIKEIERNEFLSD